MSGKDFLQLLNDKADAGEPAPCTTQEPEMFFPHMTPSVPENAQAIEDAKAVCRNCPIIANCLEFAMETEDKWAIMGGTSPADRTLIAMKRESRREKQRRQNEAREAEVLAFAKERHQVMGVAA